MEHQRDLKVGLIDQMKNLEVDDVLVCPAEEILKVQAYASKYGFRLGKTFRTRKDSERKAILLIRVA